MACNRCSDNSDKSLLGKPISRKEALKLAKKILIRAEKARKRVKY